jgi:hypothetical protein
VSLTDARQAAADPETGDRAPPLHPRSPAQSDHFRWERAMAAALDPNRPQIGGVRLEGVVRGRHPSP